MQKGRHENRQMLHVSLLLMTNEKVHMWDVDRKDSHCFHPPSFHDNSCVVEVWAYTGGLQSDLVKLCSHTNTVHEHDVCGLSSVQQGLVSK